MKHVRMNKKPPGSAMWYESTEQGEESIEGRLRLSSRIRLHLLLKNERNQK